MPLIDENQLIQEQDAAYNNSLTQLKPAPENSSGFLETVAANWKTGLTASFLDAALPRNDIQPTGDIFTMAPSNEHLSHLQDALNRTRDDPSYDWWSQIKGTPYESQWKTFQYSNNDEEFNYYMGTAQKELDLQDKMSRSSGTQNFLAGLAAGALEPINLIPGVSAFKAAGIASNIARGFIGGAATGGIIGVVNEGGLSSLQSSHDFSIEGVASSAALVGFLGAGGAAYSSIAKSTARNTITNILKDKPHETLTPSQEIFNSVYGDSAGAARLNIGDTRLAGFGKYAARDTSPNATIDDFLHLYFNRDYGGQVWKTPKYDALTSDSQDLRNLGELTFETHDLLTKNREGIPTVTSWESDYYGRPMSDITKVNQSYDQLFRDMNDSSNSYSAAIKSKFGSGIKDSEVRLELARAMRNGDTHSDPRIQAQANAYRQYLEFYKNEALKYGAMKDELHLVEGKSYLPQVWNTDKIRADINGFTRWMAQQFTRGETQNQLIKIDAAVAHLEERVKELETASKDGSMNPKIEKLNTKIQELKTSGGVDPDSAWLIAGEVRDHILNSSNYEQALSHLDVLSSAPAKVAKKRALSFIDDTAAEPWLINDAPALVAMHIQQLGRAIAFKRRILDPMGVDSPQQIISKIANTYDEQIAQTTGSTKALEAKKEAALKSAVAILKIASGTYKTPLAIDSAMEGLRAFNVVTKMGWIVLSSINDLLGPSLTNGLPTHIVHGLVPAIATSFTKVAREAGRRQLTDFSIALDVISRDAMRMILDTSGDAVLKPLNTFERGVAGSAMLFNKATLNGIWTNFTRKAAMYTEQFTLIRDLKAAAAGTASRKVLADIARRGIPEDRIPEILSHLDKFGEELSAGAFDSHLGNWPDGEAKDLFRQAILKEVNRDVVTASVGTTPYWTQKYSFAKNMNEFTSYFHGATSKLLMTSIARRDMNAANFMVASIAVGMLQYVARMTLQNRPINTDPVNMLLEGINRSGVSGIVTNPIFAFLIPGITGHAMGTSRYFKQKPLEYILGPSASVITDLFDIGQNTIKNRELTDSDKNRLKKFIPFNNVMLLDALLKQVYGDQSK